MRSKALAIAPLAMLLVGTPAAGQFPGGALESMDANRYEFMSRKRPELDAFMHQWQEAWTEPGLATLRSHYTLDALVLHPSGSVTIGPEAVDTLASGGVAEAMTAITDFEVSDYVAFAYGPLSLMSGEGVSRNGTMASILISDGRRWFLRSQLLMEDEERTYPPTPAPRPYELSGGLAEEFQRRYSDASLKLAALRTAWNAPDSAALTRLFSPRAVIALPGQPRAVRGASGIAQLTESLSELGHLSLVVIDFDSRARVSYMLGRYYLEGADGGRTGNYMAVLAREDGDLVIRALLLD